MSKYIDGNIDEYIKLCHEVHDNPELGDEEFFASKILSEKLRENGFETTLDVCGRETAFYATFSKGDGVHVAFLAEYDALQGIGHACGHSIIGTASILAAIALSKEENFKGKISVFGTPAEEGNGRGGAKQNFIEEGYFKDVDYAMMIHPANGNFLTRPTLAVAVKEYEFFGKPAHASSNPHSGINALDAMIQFFSGVGLLRQQIKNSSRVHGIITHGGDAPNIIPEYTKARFFIRSDKKEYLSEVVEKVENVLKGAAISTGCTYKITETEKPLYDFKIDEKLDSIFKEEGEKLGMEFEDVNNGEYGSTDAGNVSQVVPMSHIYLKICEKCYVPHTVEFEKATRSKEGEKALKLGATLMMNVALKLKK